MAPAFAPYGRNEYQRAMEQKIVGASFQPIPASMVSKKMKRSEARTIARVHKFLKDPKLPVRSNSFVFMAPVPLNILFVFRSTAASSAALKAKSARPLALASLVFHAGKLSAAGAAWRRLSTSASPWRLTLSRASLSAPNVSFLHFLSVPLLFNHLCRARPSRRRAGARRPTNAFFGQHGQSSGVGVSVPPPLFPLACVPGLSFHGRQRRCSSFRHVRRAQSPVGSPTVRLGRPSSVLRLDQPRPIRSGGVLRY